MESDTRERLFIEAWRGKTPFGHAKDHLAKKKSGVCAANLGEDARKVMEKYG
ncbi:MAG: hypothetical protein J4G04_05770 [Nitrosopumilaceae archaeon]|nr:hypothetical protein [Nitrosopumilaceae archaeon]